MDAEKELETDVAEVRKVLGELQPNHAKELQLAKELHALQTENKASLTLLNKRLKGINKLLKSLSTMPELREKYDKDLAVAKTGIALIQRGMPLENQGRFLSLVVGSAPLWQSNVTDRLAYKKEYEEFKKTWTWIIIGFCAAILYSPNRITESIFQFVLMLFYSTVTVREHILTVNGSRIRNWWITHQYLAIGQSILLFAWPDSASYDLFRIQFTCFSLYLGGVQLLQYWYQSRGLYAKIAMAGTDQLMAITNALPETASLTTVILALMVAYLFQLYNAWTLANLYMEGHQEWQLPVLACNFLMLGIGNIRATTQVVLSKARAFRESRAKAKTS